MRKYHGKKRTTQTQTTETKLTSKDKKTLGSIRDLADGVVQSAERGRAPYVDIPSRSLSNVRFNQSKRIIEMGGGTNRRELFNLAQARSYMQTLLVGSGCKQLIDQGKTTSIRGLFYLLKHTIEGTSEETFDTQSECDPIIEDIEVSLDSMREELHLYAKNAGAMVGPITLVDSGRRNRLRAHGLRRLQHSVDRRAGHRAVQKEHRQVRPARRKRHRLAALQRR